MSSILQNILMAFTVTVNKYASSNVQAVHGKKDSTKTPDSHFGKRSLFLSSLVAVPQLIDSKSELLEKYLKKSQENKTKNDKERLDSYYKRNYKDYFEFVEGSLQGNSELTESEKGILDWLKNNK